MKNRLYLILLVLTCCLASCKKDKEEIKDFSLEALTNGGWKAIMSDNNISTNPSTGITMYIPVLNCQQDDIYTYNASGELLVDNNKTLCSTDEPAAKQSYTIDVANKKLTVNGITYTILELNKTRLKYSRVAPLPSGVTNIIYLFGHP